MGKFTKKPKKKVDAVNTASLPDIVFMLLFFFMATTTMKDKEPLVRVKVPKASEVTKIEDKTLVKYINIGPVLNGKGSTPVIQLDDAIATTDDIQTQIGIWRDGMPDNDRNRMIVSLKVDKDTKMGIVTSVKEEMREANARKLLYSVTRTERVTND